MVVALMICSSAPADEPTNFLSRQEHHALSRLSARRGVRLVCPHHRAPHEPSHGRAPTVSSRGTSPAPQASTWPPARVAALRQAFERTLKDPEFLAEADRLALEIDLVTGETLQAIVERMFSSLRDVVEPRAGRSDNDEGGGHAAIFRGEDGDG